VWKDRTCTGCHQACRYGTIQFSGDLDWDEAYQIRFRESVEGAERGEYGYRVRATRGRILGLMHQQKREQWEELVKHCPERLYPPPGEKGALDFDSGDAAEAAEVAAAQAVAMEIPIKRAELEAQLGQAYASGEDEWEHMLAEEYRAELAYRKRHGAPRPLPQPEPIDEVVGAETERAPWGAGGYW
jgi:hypothetical protein